MGLIFGSRMGRHLWHALHAIILTFFETFALHIALHKHLSLFACEISPDSEQWVIEIGALDTKNIIFVGAHISLFDCLGGMMAIFKMLDT